MSVTNAVKSPSKKFWRCVFIPKNRLTSVLHEVDGIHLNLFEAADALAVRVHSSNSCLGAPPPIVFPLNFYL